jgi:hypothetical protein
MDETQCKHDSAVGDRKLIHDVHTHGWHVVLINPEHGCPGWAFSVGIFHNFRHPEIVMFGLNLALMHQLINNIGEQVRGGAVFKPDTEYADLLEAFDCAFRTVDLSWYSWVLGYARWFYEGDSFPALQCIWPDKEHHFPWQEEFKASLVGLQPLLFHADPRLARAEKLLDSMQHGRPEKEIK